MTDRTESLLAELVELQRRQVANQERAIAQQTESIAIQAQAVERQRVALRRVWALIGLVLLLIVGWPMLAWLLRPPGR